MSGSDTNDETAKKFARMKQTSDDGVVTTVFAESKAVRKFDIMSNLSEDVKSIIRSAYNGALLDAAAYGVMQKEKDSCNANWTKGEGTDSAALALMDEIDADFLAGKFGGRSGSGDVVQAMAAIKGCPIEEAQRAWMLADEDTRDNYRKHPKVKAHIAQLVAQRAAQRAASDSSDLTF